MLEEHRHGGCAPRRAYRTRYIRATRCASRRLSPKLTGSITPVVTGMHNRPDHRTEGNSMLRRVDSARIDFQPGWLSGKGWVRLVIGRRVGTVGVRKLHKSAFASAQVQQQQEPVFLCELEGRNYWQYQGRIYSDNDSLTAQQVQALLVTRQQREQRKVDRAVAMMERGVEMEAARRGVIPDDVKQYVFQRDGGRCRNCHSSHELQFDHIIPVAMGGSSEPENLQLLCGPCNRMKGAGLTTRGVSG